MKASEVAAAVRRSRTSPPTSTAASTPCRARCLAAPPARWVDAGTTRRSPRLSRPAGVIEARDALRALMGHASHEIGGTTSWARVAQPRSRAKSAPTSRAAHGSPRSTSVGTPRRAASPSLRPGHDAGRGAGRTFPAAALRQPQRYPDLRLRRKLRHLKPVQRADLPEFRGHPFPRRIARRRSRVLPPERSTSAIASMP